MCPLQIQLAHAFILGKRKQMSRNSRKETASSRYASCCRSFSGERAHEKGQYSCSDSSARLLRSDGLTVSSTNSELSDAGLKPSEILIQQHDVKIANCYIANYIEHFLYLSVI
jgi:hypothetical protein